MLTSERNLLKTRINTILGTLFLVSWTSGCCLMIWTFAHNDNPVATVFAKALYEDAADPQQ